MDVTSLGVELLIQLMLIGLDPTFSGASPRLPACVRACVGVRRAVARVWRLDGTNALRRKFGK